MTRFRKLPIVITAVRWTGDNADEVRAFASHKFDVVYPEDRTDDPDITAEILDDLHSTWVGVKDGQWIIRGVKGEFYPCDDEVLRATYEPAEAAPDDARRCTYATCIATVERDWLLAEASDDVRARFFAARAKGASDGR